MRAKIGARTSEAAPSGGRATVSRGLPIGVVCTWFAGFDETTEK
jgi:hypothetical protein